MDARGAIRRAAAAALLCGAASVAHAQQADSPLKNVMKMLGFATDPPQPQDFVVQSRPKQEPDYIPVFQAPPEPARPVLKDKDLGKLKGELDSVEKRDDAIRRAFPPSAKAVAEQAKAKAAQEKQKPTSASQ